MQISPSKKPEILAPAGDWRCARAAVENGADALYFGVGRFNARVRAENFTLENLPALLAFLHGRGVKGYVTFNTLLFEDEIETARSELRQIIAAGADALIVQDIGVCKLIREIAPAFPIHASTQMTVTSTAGIEFARELGASLVVAARECDIAALQKLRITNYELRKDAGAGGEVAVETFVHGALCVAYSGQCLTSEALGGRSANRGECAQACRLHYELICDGKTVPLGERRYLLSPQDLCALELLPELIAAGVTSFKIEGRLKAPEYVAAVTRAYREAVDAAWVDRERGAGRGERGDNVEEKLKEAVRAVWEKHAYALQMAFSRGLGTGWLLGVNNRELVHARFGKKRGVLLGTIEGVFPRDGSVLLRTTGSTAGNTGNTAGSTVGGTAGRNFPPLKAGDGVVFDDGHPEAPEQGGFIYAVAAAGTAGNAAGALLRLRFAREALDWRKIRAGQKLWKTADAALIRQLRETFAEGPPRFRRPITARISLTAGGTGTLDTAALQNTFTGGSDSEIRNSSFVIRNSRSVFLRLEFDDGIGHTAGAAAAIALAPAPAGTKPLDAALLRAQFGRLGGTPFFLEMLEVPAELENAGTVLPLAELNRLRREACAALETARKAPPAPPPAASAIAAGSTVTAAQYSCSGGVYAAPEIIPLIRTLPQLDAALTFLTGTSSGSAASPAAAVPTVYADFENIRDHVEAVRRASAAGVVYFAAPPRIFKDGEDYLLDQIAAALAPAASGTVGILARNHEHLRRFGRSGKFRLRGDFSLNVANSLAAGELMRRYALERITASYDLNNAQLAALLRAAPPAWFDITLHQRMPLFHMEHCVFCAFLTSGRDFRDCGRPCEKHAVRLRDRTGMEHRVCADAACRNTVFNGRAQTGAEFADALLAAGARHFRVEFVDEPPALVTDTLHRYAALLRGEITGGQLWRELKLHSQLGVTRGTLATR